MATITKKICQECNGTGKVWNVTPEWLREQRQANNLSLKDVAKSVGFSTAYICDIEFGRRTCPDAVRDFFLQQRPQKSQQKPQQKQQTGLVFSRYK